MVHIPTEETKARTTQRYPPLILHEATLIQYIVDTQLDMTMEATMALLILEYHSWIIARDRPRLYVYFVYGVRAYAARFVMTESLRNHDMTGTTVPAPASVLSFSSSCVESKKTRRWSTSVAAAQNRVYVMAAIATPSSDHTALDRTELDHDEDDADDTDDISNDHNRISHVRLFLPALCLQYPQRLHDPRIELLMSMPSVHLKQRLFEEWTTIQSLHVLGVQFASPSSMLTLKVRLDSCGVCLMVPREPIMSIYIDIYIYICVCVCVYSISNDA